MYKETINDIIESDNKEMLKSLTKTLDTVLQYLYQNNYDLYKEIYKNELLEDKLNAHLTSSKMSS